MCRRVDEQAYVYITRCEKHGPGLGQYTSLADGPVNYDPLAAMLEAKAMAVCNCGSDQPESARYGHPHLAWCRAKRTT
jgi:hypothetical protein